MKAAEKTGEVMDGEVKKEDEKVEEGSEANTGLEASKEVSKPVESTTSLVKAETSATFVTVTDPVASLALDEDAFAHTKEPKTVEELEEQIDHLQEMVGFIEKDFASTSVLFFFARFLPVLVALSRRLFLLLLWTDPLVNSSSRGFFSQARNVGQVVTSGTHLLQAALDNLHPRRLLRYDRSVHWRPRESKVFPPSLPYLAFLSSPGGLTPSY